MSLPAYEKLGAFYLGRTHDFDAGQTQDELLLYDAKDLTTHAVCVGMTGSGKTGLCISLLEEAALDGIPAIAIDPKGDIGNRLLTFPKLRPEDFEPWVDPSASTREGLTVPEYAARVAKKWKDGLAEWGGDGARIKRLRDASDVAIYTPGSNAGLPLTVLRSFRAPPEALRADGDALRDRVLGAVSGLLALLGIDADPIRSREHILLSTIIGAAWREGRDLELGTLIHAIQSPGFDKVGVMDLDSFFPAKDRFALAMTLNNLLASPGFAAWMTGEPLDVARLLWTPEGKPRLSILSIAHLSDSERMFFVTLLLNEVVAWMRTQSGTTSLRALLYMDEVFGFFPPTANPPSKTPFLTLMKQARAYGLGVVLATQNPVDLDYKGLSNAGTWFLGRLQTERDKLRVLDGLEGASASHGQQFDRAAIERVLSGVESRVFMMNNVHDDGPVLFRTRWAMSYLRGPLTRSQIKTLMADRKGRASAPLTPGGSAATAKAVAPEKAKSSSGTRPALDPGVPEAFIESDDGAPAGGELLYRPALFSRARLHYVNAARGIDEWHDVVALAPIWSGRIAADPWTRATAYGDDQPSLGEDAIQDGRFAALPKAARQPKSYRRFTSTLKAWLYRDQPLALWRCRELRIWSEPGELEGDFKARSIQLAREKRDLQLEKLKARYGSKLARLAERIRKADQKIEKEKADVGSQRTNTLVSIGQTILGAIFGRKVISSSTATKAGTTMRRADRLGKEKEDVERAQADAAALRVELEALEAEFAEATDDLRAKHDPAAVEIEAAPLRPRKADIDVDGVTLVWTPWSLDADGVATPRFPTRTGGGGSDSGLPLGQ